ncbi:unnamed protein product, partial [Sphenostylis stenocarpa]
MMSPHLFRLLKHLLDQIMPPRPLKLMRHLLDRMIPSHPLRLLKPLLEGSPVQDKHSLISKAFTQTLR